MDGSERTRRGLFGEFVREVGEKAANKAKTNVTVVRTGVVLEKGGGALGKNFAFVLFVFRRSSREWHAMGELDS